MITNTSKTPNYEWLMGGNPEAIEQQEANEQKELAISSQLPAIKNFPYQSATAKELYALMGIKVLGKSKGDEDLFLDVILPHGWFIQPTDHPMWSKLIDDNGAIRASIFYKAAFYDRSAHIDFQARYTVEAIHQGSKFPWKTYYAVLDNATNKELYTGETHIASDWWPSDVEEKKATEFLLRHYPLASRELPHHTVSYWD